MNRRAFNGVTLALLAGLAMWRQTEMVGATAPMAAPFTVSNDANLGPGSLRQAILDANLLAGPDTIVFDPGFFAVPRIITLDSELVISDSVTIDGPGASLLTISGNSITRVFSIATGPYDVTLSGLTIANGMALFLGGGIYHASTGTVALTNSRLSNNSANGFGPSNANGGGIFNEVGTLTLNNSTMSGNSANGGLGGGAFAGAGFGGAIYNARGTVTLANSTIAVNSANGVPVGQGGGIYNQQGPVTITNSTLSGNSANGLGGVGGGFYNGAGIVTFVNSTLSGNSATVAGIGGGMFNNAGNVTLINSTLSGNSASGGCCIFGGLGGVGGGIYHESGLLNAQNTIVAGNTASNSSPDAFGNYSSLGHNLIGNGAGSTGFTGAGDQVGTAGSPINALLAPLANNGGPTETHALLPPSPAQNAGDNCVVHPGCLPTPLTTDQRGTGFPRLRGNIVDIGAFEVQDDAPALAAGPGSVPDPRSALSAQKAGSVLFFNIHTSSPASLNTQNTRFNLTNTNPRERAFIHLFFVDGSNCSVADSTLCLTPNQTMTFLASEFDPGTTGYVVAVAVDSRGCPANFNYLIGDEYVKFSTGHAANLAAEAISALPDGLPVCNANTDTAVLAFNGVSYNAVPRVLALDNIPARADGNDTLLVVNRFGGNLLTAAATLNSIFGILYDDAEAPSSFTFSPGTCQFRSSLSNNFPRTAPRFETIIPAGQTGWMKFFSTGDIGLFGAAINFNPNTGVSAAAFSQGHNLHKLKLTTAMVLTIPIFPPRC